MMSGSSKLGIGLANSGKTTSNGSLATLWKEVEQQYKGFVTDHNYLIREKGKAVEKLLKNTKGGNMGDWDISAWIKECEYGNFSGSDEKKLKSLFDKCLNFFSGRTQDAWKNAFREKGYIKDFFINKNGMITQLKNFHNWIAEGTKATVSEEGSSTPTPTGSRLKDKAGSSTSSGLEKAILGGYKPLNSQVSATRSPDSRRPLPNPQQVKSDNLENVWNDLRKLYDKFVKYHNKFVVKDEGEKVKKFFEAAKNGMLSEATKNLICILDKETWSRALPPAPKRSGESAKEMLSKLSEVCLQYFREGEVREDYKNTLNQVIEEGDSESIREKFTTLIKKVLLKTQKTIEQSSYSTDLGNDLKLETDEHSDEHGNVETEVAEVNNKVRTCFCNAFKKFIDDGNKFKVKDVINCFNQIDDKVFYQSLKAALKSTKLKNWSLQGLDEKEKEKRAAMGVLFISMTYFKNPKDVVNACNGLKEGGLKSQNTKNDDFIECGSLVRKAIKNAAALGEVTGEDLILDEVNAKYFTYFIKDINNTPKEIIKFFDSSLVGREIHKSSLVGRAIHKVGKRAKSAKKAVSSRIKGFFGKSKKR